MLGRAQRKVLWAAFLAQGEWIPLVNGEALPGEKKAVRSLVAAGLIEAETRIIGHRYPKRPRIAVRITPLGFKVADTYSTPLQTGARIRASVFLNKGGERLPFMSKEGHGKWLREGNPHRERNPNPAEA